MTETEDVETEPIPSVKDLASSDPSLRRRNLSNVLEHLESRSPTLVLTSIQCSQLWRGLSVALYMHDSKSAISVQQLIRTLASTIPMFASKDLELAKTRLDQDFSDNKKDVNQASSKDKIEPEWVDHWTTSFWTFLGREWTGIDSHRLNKYYLLVRLVMREILSLCCSTHEPTTTTRPVTPSSKKQKPTKTKTKAVPQSPNNSGTRPMDLDFLSSQIQILKTYPFSTRDRKFPDGLRLHVLDVLIDEMEVVRDQNRIEDGDEEQVKGNRKRSLTSAEEEQEQEEKDKLVMSKLKRVMEVVETLAKESLSKSVKLRAREMVREFEERVDRGGDNKGGPVEE